MLIFEQLSNFRIVILEKSMTDHSHRGAAFALLCTTANDVQYRQNVVMNLTFASRRQRLMSESDGVYLH